MIDFSLLSTEELLTPGGFDCDCGLHHEAPIKFLKIGSGVVKYIPDALKALGAKKPFIVCDLNTKDAAWKFVEPVLKDAGIEYGMFCFNTHKRLEPNEEVMGAVTFAFDKSCDCVMALGSGVINDNCKIIADIAGVPAMVVGTAPSMDGYASNSSSMVVGGLKTSLYHGMPAAIIADTDIMKDAPMRMLWAGLGDMLAKYVALCEWRIAAIVNGDPYCEKIASLVRKSLEKVASAADRLADRDPEVVGNVAEGLILSGIAMCFATTSRPASGLEHYFSHMWEMMALERGEESDLHGIQVGVGCYLTFKLYERIRKLTPDREKALAFMKNFDQAKWEAETKRVFGSVAGSVLAAAAKEGRNDPEKHAKRVALICDNWDKIQKIISEEMPPFETLLKIMTPCGMPIRPAEIGISEEDVRDALKASRDIRNKYLSSTMLWDLGLLYEWADEFDGK
ncbi:MAG: sn-glycerol-1-phosphate dehydrogenase [Clostridia bacterium]|nr:sn-glycerol-1-phosphate dehydrogenase [Clostridia bacterium]